MHDDRLVLVQDVVGPLLELLQGTLSEPEMCTFRRPSRELRTREPISELDLPDRTLDRLRAGRRAVRHLERMPRAGRLTTAPEILSPEPWTFVLAVFWAVGSGLYVADGKLFGLRAVLTRFLGAVAVFTGLVLLVPIPTGVEACVTRLEGRVPSADVTLWGHAVMAGLYAAVSAAIPGRVGDVDLSWKEAHWMAIGFAFFAGPLRLVQMDDVSIVVGAVSVSALACGAWMGTLLAAHRAR